MLGQGGRSVGRQVPRDLVSIMAGARCVVRDVHPGKTVDEGSVER